MEYFFMAAAALAGFAGVVVVLARLSWMIFTDRPGSGRVYQDDPIQGEVTAWCVCAAGVCAPSRQDPLTGWTADDIDARIEALAAAERDRDTTGQFPIYVYPVERPALPNAQPWQLPPGAQPLELPEGETVEGVWWEIPQRVEVQR